MSKKSSTKNKVKKPKSLYKFILTFLIFAIGGFLLGRVILSNILATSGQRLAAANQKIASLKEENTTIENRLSLADSLEKIDGFAKQAGLVKTANVQVLTSQTPIASR